MLSLVCWMAVALVPALLSAESAVLCAASAATCAALAALSAPAACDAASSAAVRAASAVCFVDAMEVERLLAVCSSEEMLDAFASMLLTIDVILSAVTWKLAVCVARLPLTVFSSERVAQRLTA